MRKALAFSLFLGFLPFFAFAASSDAKVGGSCFDYYKFQSVELDLHGEKQVYRAGEGAKFLGSITNKNPHPLVGGSLVLRISKLDPRSQAGNDIIDEWVAQDGINLRAGEKQFVNITYQLTSGLPTGTYVLTSYFLTQNKFELAGLAFTDDIYGGYSTFNIEGQSEKSIRFDRTGVKVNEQPYRIFGFETKIFPESAKTIAVKVPLKNETNKSINASITYSLYGWDGSDPKNLLKSWSETVSLAANSSQTLSFNIDLSDRPVYFVKIVAKAGDQQSEIHLRFIKNGFRPRLHDVGVTKFPLVRGEQAVFFACYHNTTAISSNEGLARPTNIPPESRKGRLELSLKDFSGRTVDAATYAGAISGNIDVFIKQLSQRNLDKFMLSAKLYDDKDILVDSVEIPYDCSKFSSDLCLKTRFNIYFFGAGFILIIAALYFIKKHFRHDDPERT